MPVISIWVGALSLLLSIAAAAIYASSINELTDRADDAAAGKRNRAAVSPRAVVALLSAAVVVGLAFDWLWRNDTPLLLCYVAIWLSFALYSVPPFRLKRRGLLGVLCVAAGEQLFPTLVAVFIASRGSHRGASGAWVASVAAWSLALGLRAIIWHQLTDIENDRAAGVRTFASRQPRAASVVGTFVAFPLELGSLVAMLRQVGGRWPLAFLALYALYAFDIARHSHIEPVIVVPKSPYFIVLQGFYTDLFPTALLIAAAARDRRDVVVLIVHLLLFPRRVLQAIVQSFVMNRLFPVIHRLVPMKRGT